MRAYEGYFENGQFYPMGNAVRIPGRRRAFLTVLDEPARDEDTMRRVSALDKFFSAIEASDETVPEFERIHFREIEI